MTIKLYSNNCPKCQILKQKLNKKGIVYTENNDISFLKKNKIRAFPVLDVNGKLLRYYNAILWVKKQNNFKIGDGFNE